jgi:hypothetical protein
MKNILLILLFFLGHTAYSQKLPDDGSDKVRITQPDKIILAGIQPVSPDPSVKPGLFYYWYSAGAIHSTQGGFSGKLLNGQYTEYYPDKNLKEQGNFKKGLKDGVWNYWNQDGTLSGTATWKRGSEVTTRRPPLWKRLHLFRKRSNPADSLKTPKK